MSKAPLGKVRTQFANAACRQLLSYGLIGAGLNIGGYLLYLCLTFIGIDPKSAVTIGFPVVVIAGFVLNRRWTFGNQGRITETFPQYASAYVVGYVVNIVALYVFVDLLRYPHAIVQLILILSIACGLFVAQKFWIFSSIGSAPHRANAAIIGKNETRVQRK